MEHHGLLFVQDLAIIMFVAGIITILCHRFKQPVVLGYIIAGIIVGPYTPPFSYIYDQNTVKILAELGVIFLMFSLGLEFDLHKLKKVGLTSFIAAFLEIVLMTWLGYEIGRLFGWTPIDSIFLGAILSISSTTIIIKALEELGMKNEKYAHLIFGILIVEDIFAVAILALLSGVAISGGVQAKDILITTTKLSSFLVISLILGIYLVPKILAYVAKFNNKEMLLISTLGFCFGFCLLVLKLDYSIALGAFIIGAIIAESEQLKLIEQLITPMRDMFSAIFFVSVGLMFNPHVLIEYTLPIIIITIAVVVGKVLTCSMGTFITGRGAKTSVRVGMGLAQIGEFSFIIASLGLTLNVTSNFIFPIAVAVSAITTFLTPYLIRYSDPFTDTLQRILPNRIGNIFQNYTLWMKGVNSKSSRTEIKKILKRAILQIIINIFIVTAIFFSGSYIEKIGLEINFLELFNDDIQKTMIWSAALIVSLPFLVAIYLKTRAIVMLLIELGIKSLKEYENSRFKIFLRKMISEMVATVLLIGILLFASVLSSNIVAPFKLMILPLLAIFGLTALLYPWLVKLHSKLQIKLLESMKK